VNDLSERYWQLETSDKQFTKGKCFDNAAPIGPYLVTRDEVIDSSNLEIKLWVNGELRQDFNTGDYIHNDIEVISYVSQYFTLYPGDVISMGSAPGNAKSWGEQFLKPNDKVVFTIVGLGQQEQMVVHVDEAVRVRTLLLQRFNNRSQKPCRFATCDCTMIETQR
jgi:2-keto-4-pentenoate hydratase/2-oxohepta-3-ene-1,7-dioic acid hydratase in catechol pathway